MLTYDTSGNPTSYYNGASYTMTWRNGRELSTLTKGGKKTSYEYDVDGLRNLKTNADGSYSVYYWLGELLLAEQRFASATATTPTWTMVFSYDENSTPIGYQLKGTSGVWYYYYYAKNIQGDIVALYRYDKDADGNKVATHIANYEYDPWGKVLSITNASGADLSNYSSNAAVLNPFRYRGYYYDNESGFYYLQSRYYDPSIGRFINADGYVSTGENFVGYNMFAYCNNSPIVHLDYNGKDAIILYDDDSYGHIGALIQDENGNWYHYYWGSTYTGSSSGSFALIFNITTEARESVREYDGTIDINAGPIDLNAINENVPYYNGTYTNMTYLSGDFSESFSYIAENKDKYNLYSNNCSQRTFAVLASCKTKYRHILSEATEKIRPSSAFKTLNKNMATVK